jgi:hypothetical protein
MSACEFNLPAGVSASCLTLPRSVSGVIITTPDVEFTEDELLGNDNNAKWIEVIQTNKKAYLPGSIWYYETTTDDDTVNTTNIGKKLFLRNGYPSANVFIESNPCDFNGAVAAFKSGTYRILFMLEDSYIMGTQNAKTGIIKGFKCEVTASQQRIPAVDTIENAYKLIMNFKVKEEFDVRYFAEPTWIYDDILAYMPIGAFFKEYSDYTVTSDNMTVKILEPCNAPITTLDTGDIEITDSNIAGTAPVVVSTLTYDSGTKKYTLVVEDSAAAALAASDKFSIRVKSTDNTYYSNKLSITVQA